jgi:two-component system sensor histidine kinase AlgZ
MLGEGVSTLPVCRLSRSFWTAHFLGWSLFMLATVVSALADISLELALSHKGAMALSGFLSSMLLLPVYRVLQRRTASMPRLLVAAAGLSFLASLPTSALGNTMILIFEPSHEYGALHYAMSTAVAVFAWSAFYFSYCYSKEVHRQREEALRSAALAREAQLRALRYQLNPHILFNTLNAISTLVEEREHETANQMLARLSDFLRSVLHAPCSDSVQLCEEMHMLQQYLEIEQLRLGARLQFEIQVQPDAWDATVPPLVLQPLVENAVRHGIARSLSRGIIQISVTRDNGTLTMQVSDSGPGFDDDCVPGVGLTNVRQRLEHVYGSAAVVESGRSHLGGAEVTLRLPYVPVPAERTQAEVLQLAH